MYISLHINYLDSLMNGLKRFNAPIAEAIFLVFSQYELTIKGVCRYRYHRYLIYTR